MTYYPSAFCTLNDLLKQYSLDTTSALSLSPTTQAAVNSLDTVQKTKLKQYLFDCSDAIAQDWQRTFTPFIASYTVYPSQDAWVNWRYERGVLKYYLQDLGFADLLSLSSVTLDAVALSASAYRLEGDAPYDYIAFDTASTPLPTGSSFSSSAVFAGTWGYHTNPSRLWQAIGTLQSGLTDSATSFVATADTVSLFEVYQYLKIDSEFLFVTAVLTTAPYTITVERGVNGSTAASHLSAASISRYLQSPSVIRETRKRAINLLSNDAELANLVQQGESTAEGAESTPMLGIPKRWTVKAV